MVYIWCLIHFICTNPADFDKNEMQFFEKNMSDFQKSTKKHIIQYILENNNFRIIKYVGSSLIFLKICWVIGHFSKNVLGRDFL